MALSLYPTSNPHPPSLQVHSFRAGFLRARRKSQTTTFQQLFADDFAQRHTRPEVIQPETLVVVTINLPAASSLLHLLRGHRWPDDVMQVGLDFGVGLGPARDTSSPLGVFPLLVSLIAYPLIDQFSGGERRLHHPHQINQLVERLGSAR